MGGVWGGWGLGGWVVPLLPRLLPSSCPPAPPPVPSSLLAFPATACPGSPLHLRPPFLPLPLGRVWSATPVDTASPLDGGPGPLTAERPGQVPSP